MINIDDVDPKLISVADAQNLSNMYLKRHKVTIAQDLVQSELKAHS